MTAGAFVGPDSNGIHDDRRLPYGVDYFRPAGWVDAGEAVGICGFVVASSGGEGVPAVGD